MVKHFLENLAFIQERTDVVAMKSNFIIPISLQPDDVNLVDNTFIKLILSDLTDFIVCNI